MIAGNCEALPLFLLFFVKVCRCVWAKVRKRAIFSNFSDFLSLKLAEEGLK